MLKKVIMFAAVAGLVFALAPVASAQYSAGFEPGEAGPDFTGSATGTPLIPNPPALGQDNWDATSWLKSFNVHTYAGNQASYLKTSLEPDAVVTYNIPVNPTGGQQFLADDEIPSTVGHAISNVHDVAWGGLQEMSIDYFPGEELGNSGNWNGALLARDPGNNAGFYTGKGSSSPAGNPSPGPWAPQFIVFDLAGAQIKTAGLQGYRFDGVPGFDNLDMEQWYRVGVVIDWPTRKVLEIKSQKLIVGAPAISVLNPKGPAGEDLYVKIIDPATIQHVRLFDAGNHTLTGFDNIHVGAPYDWPDVVPEPATMSLLALGGLAVLRRRRSCRRP